MLVRPLPPELAEIAKQELNEDPKRLSHGIQHLKDWIAKQQHLNARTDDQWLAAFIRGCKFNMEKVKYKIDVFYSIRSVAPSLHQLKYSESRFMEILELGITLIMPKTKASLSQPRITIFRMGCYDASKYSLDEVIAVSLTLQHICMIDDDSVIVCGSTQVVDVSNLTIGHIANVTPALVKRITAAGQDALPFRVKKAYYIKVPSFFEKFFNAFKHFFNETYKKRTYFLSKSEKLTDFISTDTLPVEYGGNGSSVEEIIDYWKKKIIEYSDWLNEDLKYGTDESMRIGTSKISNDSLGVAGSFRQLDLD